MPISGPKTITLKAVLELFTGTFCIFVVSVLVWKLGKFFRRFTKEKVIGGGNSPARRYTKTWYGWVSLQRQKPDRSIVQRCFAKFRQWTTWHSAKNSYCSIWWSFDQKELEACKQFSMRRQSLPTHLRECKLTTANTIHTPYGYTQSTGKGGESYSSPKMTGVLQSENVSNTRAEGYKLPRRRRRRNVSSAKELFRVDLPCVGPVTREKRPTNILNYCKINVKDRRLFPFICIETKFGLFNINIHLRGYESPYRPKEVAKKTDPGARRTPTCAGQHRKLGWLSYQLMPGRKPFHFPLLPNHWLNIRTWIVYDPASRAPIDVKRQFGDPRYKTPSPTPRRPKRKYPRVARRVVNIPRIESWRIAVNQNRKASGLRDFVKRVELYDDSADDPPDGYIDPACWLIRKPPQGHQLSARQDAAYYEGGAGWQERLDDWQNIRRWYRIRKAIHEGRANRTRVKQTAVGISQFCQTAWYRRQKQQT
ncbi:hypothetical protein BDV40DRAFT_299122 [Aspergillus tamarii]|uniref:Uncharacterized protein n=1 Tax=Aspergillus tamarii TaxID=41984 RepID=A0A5N6UYU0_ASPTM|nr:hypothetical protein BDV40DRAFT_299122 [Aspergillus tamarii]